MIPQALASEASDKNVLFLKQKLKQVNIRSKQLEGQTDISCLTSRALLCS